MSERIIKNYTTEDYIIKDLGNIIVPANGAVDVGGDESRLIELATSDDILKALSQGTDKFQLNNGSRDLGFSEGIDIIRKISRPTDVDTMGRWVIRSDSRKKDYEIIFVGRGDKEEPREYGKGTWLKWDFSAPASDPRWVQTIDGWKKQRVEFKFLDGVLLKEGAFYFYDMPKDSYMNFFIEMPANNYYSHKSIDSEYNVHREIRYTTEQIILNHWVQDYPLEGTAAMGDELNTESAQDIPAPNHAIWVFEVMTPETPGWEKGHGHVSLEIYRYTTVYRE